MTDRPDGFRIFTLHTHLPLCLIFCCLVTNEKTKTTLSGGSLGSCVDEERSQLRELM